MSVLIGLHIQERLSKNKKVTEKVGDRIFPIVATQGSPAYPFIIFDSSVSVADETKDGCSDEIASVVVSIFGKSYGEALHIAHAVKKDLEHSEIGYQDFEVVESAFIRSEEDYNDELAAYIINLNFEFITAE